MRGKGGLPRLTVLHAGKRTLQSSLFTPFRDHPRVCGEKFDNPKIDNSQLGSPPRMRGKAPFPSGAFSKGGITPAYAGKRISVPSIQSGAGDHPRVCGEKLTFGLGSSIRTGSPPRMRGKAAGFGLFLDVPGITPAYAGKSLLDIFIFDAGIRITPAYAGKRPSPRL